ncbi:MAG: NAD(P)H-hydrate dehydratase [Bryobacterales bacterium]|nr:NAD(P)H-hydrate dehydratase [Bryobacterales bacterium]
MKVLTAAQMRSVDGMTIERGIPGLILMENAAHRVVEYMASRFAPLREQRIVVFCGKGNNGGDGLAIARQLHTRFGPRALDVLLTSEPAELQGDAAANLRMLIACGVEPQREITAAMQRATLVVDAILGTGVRGPAEGRAAQWIAAINAGFPDARVVAVDLPSGMVSDSGDQPGEVARADASVTFTAPKMCHALPPNCDRCGDLIVAAIGSPASLFEDDPAIYCSLMERHWFTPFFRPRPRTAHKGDFGHVLVVAGSRGKTGAAAMTGIAALRSGAGLVTVASAASAVASISAYAPELMTEPLPENEIGSVAARAYPMVETLAAAKTMVAIGPGLGLAADTTALAQNVYSNLDLPAVFDADAITAVANTRVRPEGPRILTPHPGEMARFCACSTAEIQANRIGYARSAALDREVTIVLKGQRTIVAFPDGRVWINPTGSPAMATAGSGDILTGLIAGLMGQFQDEADYAIGAAVWLHGRAGELGAAALGEKSLVATDLLRYLPQAMSELS